MDNRSNFIAKMTPYANRAAQATGIPVEVILTQWGHESGWGTSRISQPGINNFGGIKWVAAATQLKKDGMYAAYKSIGQFVDDYIRVMSSDRYSKIRNAVSVEDTIKAYTGSPYAEDQSYSKKLAEIYNSTFKGKINIDTSVLPRCKCCGHELA